LALGAGKIRNAKNGVKSSLEKFFQPCEIGSAPMARRLFEQPGFREREWLARA
jgi:hypothetical protein